MDAPRPQDVNYLGYPNKSPYVFASRQSYLYGPSFDQMGLKIFDADEEMVIAGAICINADVLNYLSDSSTLYHIGRCMEASCRSVTLGPDINRSVTIMLMISCIGYSFCGDNFPY